MAVTFKEYDHRTKTLLNVLGDKMKAREIAIITGEKERASALRADVKSVFEEMLVLQDSLPNANDNPLEVVRMIADLITKGVKA